jgi:CRP-like cAMP-binding protein
MSVDVRHSFGRPKNHLLAALPEDELRRLRPLLHTVSLRRRQILQKQHEPIQHVYFLNGGVASIATVFANGSMVEVALVGDQGMVGIEAFFSDRPVAAGEALVQVVDDASDAERITVEDFRRELVTHRALWRIVGRYAQTKLAEIFQTAACNALHPVRERCARWLLLTHDRMHQPEFGLSHDLLAVMLGVTRPTVTEVAGALQDAGVVRYKHGRLKIIDRQKLEAASCECYAIMRTAFEELAAFYATVGYPTDTRNGSR